MIVHIKIVIQCEPSCFRFRLRRHSHSRHPDKPIKWIDLQSGQVCVDSRQPEVAAQPPIVFSQSAPLRLKATARKSAVRSMKVALFRSSLFGQKKREALSLLRDRGSDDELLVIDTDSDNNNIDSYDDTDGDDDVDVAIDSSETESSSQHATSILRFCCHLCPFSVLALSPSALTQHLFDMHSESRCLPRVEFMMTNDNDNDDDESSSLSLHRCSLCSFESFIQQDFDSHVLDKHGLNRPVVCDVCRAYAAFSESLVTDHFKSTHPGQQPQMSSLDRPYVMLPLNNSNSSTADRYFSLKAFVQLEDIVKLSSSRLDSLLATNSVTVAVDWKQTAFFNCLSEDDDVDDDGGDDDDSNNNDDDD